MPTTVSLVTKCFIVNSDEDVRKTSAEEVPMMTFTLPDDINVELRNWIDETLA